MSERLRPWAAAGLEYLLASEGLCDEVAVAQAPSAATLAPSSARSSSPSQAISAPAEAFDAPWPEPWATLASRVRVQPRVIITYASLAEDLTGNADPARRKLFQSVLAFLGWPPGTTLFWPLRFPKGREVPGVFAVDVFAAGVRRFAIQHILCFGDQTAEQAQRLFPADDPANKVRVHVAPRPEALIGLLPHELHQALAVLKSIELC